MAFWISPEVSNRDPIISFSSRANNGQGLILRAIIKTHIIICLSNILFHYFDAFGVKKM